MKLTSIKQVYEKLVHIQSILELKEEKFLDVDQTAEYLAVKRSYIYSLINQKQIPYYKPGGKKVYFKKTELHEWIKKSRISSIDDVQNEVLINGQIIKNVPMLSRVSAATLTIGAFLLFDGWHSLMSLLTIYK